MKIAIYHGFNLFHFEMIGYIMDYLINYKINFDIYSFNNKEWKFLYEKIFNIYKEWLNPMEINISNYEYIFLITDDDISLNNKLFDINYKKIICINHYDIIRRNNVYEYINTRFFCNSLINKWALPCYNYISKIDKYNLLVNKKINIACIGIHNMPISEDHLKSLFNNFFDINFHLIARHINIKINKYNNIKLYIDMNTNDMIDLLKICNYILCFNNSYDLIYKCMSGCIPLSFTLGCKLIIPNIWNKYYNFKSCITYDNNIILDNDLNYLNILYDEQNDLINHRNNIFNNIININLINWYSTIYNLYNIKNTNIIINIGYNISNDIYIQKSFFTKIYGLELNNDDYTFNQYKYDENIFIYKLNEFNILFDIINNINNIIIFNLINNNNNNNYDEFNNIFEILNKRQVKDFIILSNYNNNNNNIKFINKYNKLYIYYIYNKINKIFIYPL
jgi:hypothetical protein